VEADQGQIGSLLGRQRRAERLRIEGWEKPREGTLDGVDAGRRSLHRHASAVGELPMKLNLSRPLESLSP
jgi:hypothetical protein